MFDSTGEDRFTTLLAQNRPYLRKVTLMYGVSPEDREDLHQEILVQLWRSFASYDSTRPFATWMYRVALNVAISRMRQMGRDRRIVAPHAIPLEPADPQTQGDDADERLTRLRYLMTKLDEFERALLLLHLEERSYREIAEVLGIRESNVGTKLNRLRQRLRELTVEELKR